MSADNLASLEQQVQDLGYGTDTVQMQQRALNNVYRDLLGMKHWKFLEKQDSTLSTVVGTATYTIPMSDWRTIDAVRIAIPSITEYDRLRYMEEQDLRELSHRDTGSNGRPQAWTIYAGLLWLWPTPDNIYTVTFDYISQPAALVNPADVPVIPEAYTEILVWGAVSRLALRQRDWLTREFADGEYEKLLQRMLQDNSLKQRQSGTHVKTSGNWSSAIRIR